MKNQFLVFLLIFNLQNTICTTTYLGRHKFVSALVREENIAAHGWAGKIFSFLSMRFSLNKAALHFSSLVRRPKRSRKLNTKLGTFSKLSYNLSKKQCFVFLSGFPLHLHQFLFNKKITASLRDFSFAVVQERFSLVCQ